MENSLKDLYKHYITHPIVADAYLEEKEDLPTQILINEVPDTSVQAHMDFNPEPPAPTKYTITTEVSPEGSGTVTGGGKYDENATVTLTATPTEGYVFVKWNNYDTNSTIKITVTGDATYTATFKLEEGNGANTTQQDDPNQGENNATETNQPDETDDPQDESESEENGEVGTLDPENPETNGE